MSKELEALRKILYYDQWDCYHDEPKEMRKDEEEAYNYILKILTPPTAGEVVKALSEQLKSAIVLRKNKHGITFNYADTGKTLISLNYDLVNIGVQLPPHLVTLIGRFYEGE